MKHRKPSVYQRNSRPEKIGRALRTAIPGTVAGLAFLAGVVPDALHHGESEKDERAHDTIIAEQLQEAAVQRIPECVITGIRPTDELYPSRDTAIRNDKVSIHVGFIRDAIPDKNDSIKFGTPVLHADLLAYNEQGVYEPSGIRVKASSEKYDKDQGYTVSVLIPHHYRAANGPTVLSVKAERPVHTVVDGKDHATTLTYYCGDIAPEWGGKEANSWAFAGRHAGEPTVSGPAHGLQSTVQPPVSAVSN